MSEAVVQPLIPPNLGSVITGADITQKGTGSYVADYVNWCRTAQLLREHAPGWQFHLRSTSEGQHVWRAPNGTGYVVGFFEGPGGTITPDFPQAVMNNRNEAVQMDKINARDVTDTHRRCLCTAAAAQFGLAWQLWAKEPVENPHREVNGDTLSLEPVENPHREVNGDTLSLPGSQRSSSQQTSRPGSSAPRQPSATVVRRGSAAGQPAPASQPPPAQQPQPAGQPLSGAAATTAAAIRACKDAGLTELGIAAMAHELSAGKSGAIAGLPIKVQEKLITLGVSPASATRWNDAGAQAADAASAAEDDPPMLWAAPVTT